MPSKIQLDENLWFLFICLQKSDYKTIDFNAVGQATNLKSPAARMRYTRLRRQIEGGTLIGTHGTPFAEKMPSETRRRTRDSQSRGGEFVKTCLPDRKIKSEAEDFSDRYETDSSEGEDSADEMPLAKRRQNKVESGNVSPEASSVAVSNLEFCSGLHDGQGDNPLQLNTQLNISYGRPKTYKDYQAIFQDSKPSHRLQTPEIHHFDVIAQPLEENEGGIMWGRRKQVEARAGNPFDDARHLLGQEGSKDLECSTHYLDVDVD